MVCTYAYLYSDVHVCLVYAHCYCLLRSYSAPYISTHAPKNLMQTCGCLCLSFILRTALLPFWVKYLSVFFTVPNHKTRGEYFRNPPAHAACPVPLHSPLSPVIKEVAQFQKAAADAAWKLRGLPLGSWAPLQESSWKAKWPNNNRLLHSKVARR